MALGPKQDGTTVNAAVAQNASTGQTTYTLNDPTSMSVNLNNAADVTLVASSSDDRINLQNSSGVTINGGGGNDTFVLGSQQTDLNGNIIKGGSGYDFIQLTASGQSVDLTQGSSGVEAVVGRRSFSGDSVTIRLDQLSLSALNNGSTGRAFTAVIGNTGEVNVVQPVGFKLVGIVDSANHGFTATGEAITGDALTSLLASVTSFDGIAGNLASMYAGSASVPAHETHIATEMNGYVFMSGTKAYTIWTDGTVIPFDKAGNELPAAYHPEAAVGATPQDYGMVDTFDKTGDYGMASLKSGVDGTPILKLDTGSTDAYSTIVLKAGVTGQKIIGDSGANGPDYFGLGLSGGANQIVGSKGGNVYDLQKSTELQDFLVGGKGYDIVKAATDGSDVDLTINNAYTAKAATGIDAVTGSINGLQTVEVDLMKLAVANDASGTKVASFAAMLGSLDDVVTVTGTGRWVEVGTFAPGAALPDHAAAIGDPDLLDQVFGSRVHTAENSLVGHLFEQVDNQGDAIRYVTVYTDATIQNDLLAPIHGPTPPIG